MKYRIQWDYAKAQSYRGEFLNHGGPVIDAESSKQAVEKLNSSRA